MAPTAVNREAKGASAPGPTPVQIVRKNFSDTVISSIRTLGAAILMGFESVIGFVSDVATGKFKWKEAIHQAWYLVTVTAVPGILMAIPFGIIVSVQVGNLIHQLGADSLLGAAGGQGVITQGAPMATGLLLGGAGAAAIASDLGARTVREEIDALKVMGISPVHRLVIPRMVAMLCVAPLLNLLIIFVGVAAGYIVAITAMGVTSGSYWLTFGSFATVGDVFISMGKSVLFGFIVVMIACQRGLGAKGGPRGVADGVNASVVLSVAVVSVVNVLITQVLVWYYPLRLA